MSPVADAECRSESPPPPALSSTVPPPRGDAAPWLADAAVAAAAGVAGVAGVAGAGGAPEGRLPPGLTRPLVSKPHIVVVCGWVWG